MAYLKQKSILPGFGLSMGYTLSYLSLLVLIPLSSLFFKTYTLSWPVFWETISNPRVVASYKLTFLASAGAAFINAWIGLLIAWVLTRYPFPGKKIFDAMVDLPFALPTAVAGITLTTLYSENGWIGHYLAKWNIKISYTPAGILIALVFISLPFVVRTVQPVLQGLDPQLEEAASSLGASRWKTFIKVVFPTLFPALLTGFTLSFARALGEYGSVVFISGNMPMKTEITPLLIMSKLEQFDYAGATAIAVVMLITSFVLLFLINMIQAWQIRRTL